MPFTKEELKELSTSVVSEVKPILDEQAKTIKAQADEIAVLKTASAKSEAETNALVDKKVHELIRDPVVVKEFAAIIPSARTRELDNTENLEKKVEFAKGIQFLAAGRIEKALNYLAEGTTAGTFVVPKFLMSEIIMNMGKYGSLRRYGPAPIPINPDTNLVDLGGLLTGVVMTKTAEAVAITQSEPTFQLPQYNISVWGALCSLTNQVIKDALVLAARLPAIYAEAAAKALDKEWLNTAAIGLVQKCVNVDILGGATLSGNLTYDNFVNAEGYLDDVDLDGAVWIGNKAFRKEARLVKDLNNVPIFQQIVRDSMDGSSPKMLMGINGIPLITNPVMPDGTGADTVCAVLCNPSKVTYWSMLEEMEIEMFRAGSDANNDNAITKNLTIMRVLMRAGLLNFVPVDVDNNATGLAGLKTKAA